MDSVTVKPIEFLSREPAPEALSSDAVRVVHL